MKFNIVLEEDLEDGGYIVHCPALKGCWSQGDTAEEALQNIKEAIAGYLKTLNERAILDFKIQSKAQIREVAVA
jgi:predicted RNase H-like HicB family nuclease